MSPTRAPAQAQPNPCGARHTVPQPTRAQRLLQWATVAAILTGGLNALAQLLRLALGP